MATERSVFQWGGATFPVTASTAQSLLQDSDPAIYWVLDYFAWVLSVYLDERFVVEATAANLPAAQRVVVAQSLPYDPLPFLKDAHVKFPLLAVWRNTAKVEQVTNAWDHSTSQWSVLWSLPPLTAAQMERLSPAREAVARIITNRTTLGWDPSYRSEAIPWDATHAGVEELGVTGWTYGNMPGSTPDVFFPSILMSLEVIERESLVSGSFDPLAGTDDTLNLKASNGTTDGFTVAIKTP